MCIDRAFRKRSNFGVWRFSTHKYIYIRITLYRSRMQRACMCRRSAQKLLPQYELDKAEANDWKMTEPASNFEISKNTTAICKADSFRIFRKRNKY